MKHEWKKHEKEIYGVKAKPCVLDIPLKNISFFLAEEILMMKSFQIKLPPCFRWLIKLRWHIKRLLQKATK